MNDVDANFYLICAGEVAVQTSVAKDPSLTVVLTGKPEQVRKAKVLLTSQLQTTGTARPVTSLSSE